MNAESRRITFLDMLCFAAFGLLLAVVIGAGVRSRTDRYSCHVCRGLKAVHTTTYYGLVLDRKESPIMKARAGINHQHSWWKYSHVYHNGPWGCFGSGVACSARQYQQP